MAASSCLFPSTWSFDAEHSGAKSGGPGRTSTGIVIWDWAAAGGGRPHAVTMTELKLRRAVMEEYFFLLTIVLPVFPAPCHCSKDTTTFAPGFSNKSTNSSKVIPNRLAGGWRAIWVTLQNGT